MADAGEVSTFLQSRILSLFDSCKISDSRIYRKGAYGLLFLAAGRREEPAHFRQVGGWERGNVGSVIGSRMVIFQMLML